MINIQNHKPGAGEIATIWTSAALGVWAILIGDCCCEEFKGVEGILVCCCTIVGMESLLPLRLLEKLLGETWFWFPVGDLFKWLYWEGVPRGLSRDWPDDVLGDLVFVLVW